MCGINGLYYFNQQAASEQQISKMNLAIAHRGPDDNGIFVRGNTGLGQVRLSIIDLSSAGRQPMFSPDGRLALIFNGEIYNYRKLKSQLADYPFRTETDSEVLLAAYLKWGKSMVEHLEGMFAFVILDLSENKLFIARDRLGIKPLYYYQNEDFIVFSSEIRGLLASGLFTPELDKNRLPEFFRIGSVTGENTLLKDVKLLPPATCALISDNKLSFESYWQLNPETATEDSYEQAKKTVHELFLQAVEKRLVADVPFGAFLSGGIDSTAVTAAMSECISGSVNTFNVSFDESEFSEARYAEIVAKKFGTRHTEIKLKPNVFLDEIENILSAYDHPGFDGANTYIVSQATRKAGITMALSGLGGDELFGGYPVFRQLQPSLNKLKQLPSPARKTAAVLLRLQPNVRRKKIAELLALSQPDEAKVYETFRSLLGKRDCKELVGAYHSLVNPHVFERKGSFMSKLSAAEFHYYMQPVLLRDTDQMSMAHALEVRVPFLDHKLAEYVLSLPDAYKTKTPVQKSLLVESLADLLPSDIVHRKKMGFVLPWEKWLKTELYSFVQSSIDKAGKSGLVDSRSWQTAYNDFRAGKRTYNWNVFWGLVTLVNWLERNRVKVG